MLIRNIKKALHGNCDCRLSRRWLRGEVQTGVSPRFQSDFVGPLYGYAMEVHAGTQGGRRDRPDPLHDHLQGVRDLSILHGDGTNTVAKKGGDGIGYSGHKHQRVRSNWLRVSEGGRIWL
jgi:hypothetical protein